MEIGPRQGSRHREVSAKSKIQATKTSMGCQIKADSRQTNNQGWGKMLLNPSRTSAASANFRDAHRFYQNRRETRGQA
ncbi:MAG: hypothetical protein V4713_16715 [Pseudomonadota bacterium]